MEAKQINNDIRFLAGGGEMGRLTREKDWSQTSLGAPQTWPQSLRTTLSIILSSKFPMFLFWGDELTCFYNDAYRPSLGGDGKHPAILGMRAEEAWPEIWDDIKPLIDEVLAGGESSWAEDQLLPIYRNGKLEDVYWTFSYSPVHDESGKPAGVFVTCSETTKQVLAYAAVKDSKEELEFAIDATELGTWDLDPLTNKFSANDRLKSWFGLAPEERIELDHAVNAIAEQDKQRVTEAIQKVLDYSSGGSYDIEYTIVHPVTKKETIVHAKGRAWFNEDKVPYRFNGTLEDVTEKVTARKQVELSEARFRNLINQSPMAMVVFRGPEQIIEIANSAMLKRWGKTRQELEEKKFLDVFPEIKKEKIPGLLNQVYNTGKSYREVESLSYIQDGNATSYVDFEYSPLRDAEGKVSGVIATVTDITEKVLSRKKIEESEQRFAAAVEAVKGIVWTNNYKGEMSGEQVSWAALTGQQYDEYQGYGWSNAIHPDDVQPTIDAWHEAVKAGSVFNFEHRVKLKDGTWRAFSVKAIPLKNEDGSVREWVGVHTDIQKQKTFASELERQVQDRTKQLELKNIELEKMNKELQSFAYISSHDLQEPLRKIQTFSSLIMGKELAQLSDAGRDYFSRMQSAAKRMQTLIDDLLAYSRTNSSERKFELIPFDSIVSEIKADFREELAQKNATIDAEQLCAINIIPFQFRQLLQNLVSNAIKFSSPDRDLVIKITCQTAMGKELNDERLLDNVRYRHIRISDNGIGFDQQFSDRIFELFQRLHGRTEYNGTGIGLAIVKRIIENHEGIISAHGELDKGARFDIYLPAR